MSKQTEILCEIVEERGRQDLMWGVQQHPIKPSGHKFTTNFKNLENDAKEFYKLAESTGNVTWYNILWEEFCGVFAENDPKKQREKLIQLNAGSLAMIEYLDRRYPRKDEV